MVSFFENLPVAELLTVFVLVLITIFRRKLSSNHEYRHQIKQENNQVTKQTVGKLLSKKLDAYTFQIEGLSTEVLIVLLGYLSTSEIIQIMQVSKPLLGEVRADFVWEQLWIQTYGNVWQNPKVKKLREDRHIYWDPCLNFGPPHQAIDGSIYDVTHFLHEHPGSLESLTEGAGCDATEAFRENGHSSYADKLMKKLYLWDCKDYCKPCTEDKLSISNNKQKAHRVTNPQYSRHIVNSNTRLRKQMKVNQAIIMNLAHERNSKSFLNELPAALTSSGNEAYKAIVYQTSQLSHSINTVTATAAAAASTVTATATNAAATAVAAASSTITSISTGGMSMEDIMVELERKVSDDNSESNMLRELSTDSTEQFLTSLSMRRDNSQDDEYRDRRLQGVDNTNNGNIRVISPTSSESTSSRATLSPVQQQSTLPHTADQQDGNEAYFTRSHKVVPSLDGYFDHSVEEQQQMHNDDAEDREYKEHFGQPKVFFDPLSQDWTVWWTCCGKGEVLVEAAPSAAMEAAIKAQQSAADELKKKLSLLPSVTSRSMQHLINSSYFQQVANTITSQQEPIFLSLKSMYKRVKEITVNRVQLEDNE